MSSFTSRLPADLRGLASSRNPNADEYDRGYRIGKLAELGDDLPHPQDSHFYYHGMRAALYGKGLKPSAFLRVIPAETP